MRRKIRNTVSILLVTILLLPMTIQLLDGIFHHHDHFVCKAKTEHHFHNQHKKCLVSAFELSYFSKASSLSTTVKRVVFADIQFFYAFVYSFIASKYSFLLRAPPRIHKY